MSCLAGLVLTLKLAELLELLQSDELGLLDLVGEVHHLPALRLEVLELLAAEVGIHEPDLLIKVIPPAISVPEEK